MSELNLTSIKQVRQLLDSNGIAPNKTLGQNFLIDRNILDAIVAESEPCHNQKVLEVGPGLGVLTEQLMNNFAHVTAIEKDNKLYDVLEKRWGEDNRLTLIHDDALNVNLNAIYADGTTGLISNLPYSVGVRVVVDSALCDNPPEIMLLLLQREVCQRFIAKPNSDDIGYVSIWLQRMYDISIVKNVPPNCFFPPPAVVSSVVKLKRQHKYDLNKEDAEYFNNLVKIAYGHRRKQLASSMKNAPMGYARNVDFTKSALVSIGLPETARPEVISLEQWLTLAKMWKNS